MTRSKWWGKVLGSFVGASVLALGLSASALANMDDPVTQDEVKTLREEVRALREELHSLKAAKSELPPAISEEVKVLKEEVESIKSARQQEAAPAITEEVKSLRDEIKSIKAAKSEVAPAITGNVYSELSRKIKLGGEVRARFESFYNFDFSGKPTDTFDDREGSHTEITLLRTRLNLDADINDYLRAYLELQDNRAFGDEDELDGAGSARKTGVDPVVDPRGTMGNLGRVDLLQGFMELKSFAPVSPALSDLSLLIGRWQMNYGGERLIGKYDWSNQGRAWDGARIRWSGKDSSWIDGFVTQIDEDRFDPRGIDSDEVFWGIYGHSACAALKGIVDEIEPYFLGRNQSNSVDENGEKRFGGLTNVDRENRYTTGLRLAGEPTVLPGLDYELEGVYQFGHVELESVSVGEQDIDRAYAFYASAGYTLKDMPWTPRFGGGFSYASGDDDEDNDNLNTFDQLYPSGNELGLGHMELVGWQNIIDYRVNLSAKPTKKWLLKADFHFLYLAEEEDAWYNANGIAIARWNPAEGNSPNDQLGKELDLTAKYELFKNFHVALGYSHFFAGNFIQDDAVRTIADDGSPTGDKFGGSDADWFYVMTTVRF